MCELVEINLLPIEERKIKKDYSYLLDSKIVIPTLAVIIMLMAYRIGESVIKNDIEDKNEKMKSMQVKINANNEVLAQIKKLEQLLKEKKAKNLSLKSISFNKKLWVRILEGLSKTLPPNTWIREIRQQNEKEEELTLTGVSHLFSEVAMYMIALEEDEYFLRVGLNKIEVEVSEVTEAFRFTLNITVNLNLGAQSPSLTNIAANL